MVCLNSESKFSKLKIYNEYKLVFSYKQVKQENVG